MNIYIYSYINKFNGHRYIGKTDNVQRRQREHYSQAYNKNSKYYNALWPKKIRQYGYDNFEFEILEIVNENNWQEREQYWISFYNTFKGVGYNTTPGGDSGDFEPILTDEEVNQIYELLENSNLTQQKIASQIGISESLVSNINQGNAYKKENYHYPIRVNYKKGLQDYNELINLLRTTTKSFKQIAKELGIGESTVKKINYGTMWFDSNMSYPIRKQNSFQTISEQIKNLLINTDMSFSEIAKLTGKSVATVSRINQGKTYYEEKYSYPLRSNL